MVGTYLVISEEAVQTFDDVSDYFGRWLQRFVDESQGLPGIQATVRSGNGRTRSYAVGWADREQAIPMRTSHRLRMASQTKSVTAVALLRLVEEGKLDLGDPLEDHLSIYGGTPIGSVMVGQVLEHSAGVIRDVEPATYWWDLSAPLPTDAEVSNAATSDRAVNPAAAGRFKYSNLGYALLGQLISAVSGRPYEEFVRTRVLSLVQGGHAEIGFEAGEESAIGYGAPDPAGHRMRIEDFPQLGYAPCGGIYANTESMAGLYSKIFDPSFLTPKSRRVMCTQRWETGLENEWYGLGIEINQLGTRRCIGHGGGLHGFSSRTLCDMDSQTTVSIASNAVDTPVFVLARHLFSLLDLAEDSGPRCGPEWDRIIGRYWSSWGSIEVVRFGSRMFVLNPANLDVARSAIVLEQRGTSLIQRSANGYGNDGEPMDIELDSSANVVSLRLMNRYFLEASFVASDSEDFA